MDLTYSRSKRLTDGLKVGYNYVIEAVLCSKCESIVSEVTTQQPLVQLLKEQRENTNLFITKPGEGKPSEDVYRRLRYQNGCRRC